ncbi:MULTISPECIES: hypothetical protein [unclassified Bradyrhizobium]
MTQTGTRRRLLRAGVATFVGSITLADVALASQGPGGGMGTASHLTQLLMAVVVYGTSGVVAVAAMIGAARRRARS